MNQKEWEASIERIGVVAGCLIAKDGKYLLVQERQASAYGLWNLPAGHVDKGESLEAAAIREVKEETGFDVQIVTQLALYHEAAAKSVKHVYLAKIIGGDLKGPDEEILDLAWLTFEEIASLNQQAYLRAPWVWDVIEKHHNSLRKAV